MPIFKCQYSRDVAWWVGTDNDRLAAAAVAHVFVGVYVGGCLWVATGSRLVSGRKHTH